MVTLRRAFIRRSRIKDHGHRSWQDDDDMDDTGLVVPQTMMPSMRMRKNLVILVLK